MYGGFVKFRRGLVDHLHDGRITADEYCVFSLMVQLADYNTGIWRGSGVALSDYLKWCPRKCQLILKSLQSKGYLKLRVIRGRKGNYPVIIHKYHESVEKVANGDASLIKSGESGCVTSPKVANGGATLKEVLQEENKEKTPRQNRPRLPSNSSEQVQRQNHQAKTTRVHQEVEGLRESNIGAGAGCEATVLRGIERIAVKMASLRPVSEREYRKRAESQKEALRRKYPSVAL